MKSFGNTTFKNKHLFNSNLSVILYFLLILLQKFSNADQIYTCVCMNGGLTATFKAQCPSGQAVAVRETRVAVKRNTAGQTCGALGVNTVTYDPSDCFINENLNARWAAAENCNGHSSEGCTFSQGYSDSDFQSCTSPGFRYSCLRYECVTYQISAQQNRSVVYMTSGGAVRTPVTSLSFLRTQNYAGSTTENILTCSLILPPNIFSLIRLYDYRGRYTNNQPQSGTDCPYNFYINGDNKFRSYCASMNSDYVDLQMNTINTEQRVDLVFVQYGNPARGALWIVIETNSDGCYIECGSNIQQRPVPGISSTTTTTTPRPTTTPTTPTTTTTTTTPATTTTTTTTPKIITTTTTISTPKSVISTPSTSQSTTLSTLSTSTLPVPSSTTSNHGNSVSQGVPQSTTAESPQTGTTLEPGEVSGSKLVRNVALGVSIGVGGTILLAVLIALFYFFFCASHLPSEKKRPPTPPRSIYDATDGSLGWDDTKIAHNEANNNTKITKAKASQVKAKAAAVIMSYDQDDLKSPKKEEIPPPQKVAYDHQVSLDEYGKDTGNIYDVIDDASEIGTVRNKVILPVVAPKIATISEEYNSGTMASDSTYRRVRFQDKPELIKMPAGYIEEEEESNLGIQNKNSNLNSYAPKNTNWEWPELSGPKWTGPSYPSNSAPKYSYDEESRFGTGLSNISDDEKSERLHRGMGVGNSGSGNTQSGNFAGNSGTNTSSKKGFKLSFGKSSQNKTPISVPANSNLANHGIVIGSVDESGNDVMQNPLYGHASMIF